MELRERAGRDPRRHNRDDHASRQVAQRVEPAPHVEDVGHGAGEHGIGRAEEAREDPEEGERQEQACGVATRPRRAAADDASERRPRRRGHRHSADEESAGHAKCLREQPRERQVHDPHAGEHDDTRDREAEREQHIDDEQQGLRPDRAERGEHHGQDGDPEIAPVDTTASRPQCETESEEQHDGDEHVQAGAVAEEQDLRRDAE